MPAYGEAHYWDERYARDPSAMEWYADYAALAPVLRAHVPPQAKVLQVGVGLSLLQADMVRHNACAHVLSIDTSAVAIRHLRELHKADAARLSYRVGDARHMPQYAAAAFDAVLDKGTLDALMCSHTAADDVAAMLGEVCRVLRPGGAFVCVSYGEPPTRLPLLACGEEEAGPLDWGEVVLYVVGRAPPGVDPAAPPSRTPLPIEGPFPAAPLAADPSACAALTAAAHYVYVCTKRGGSGSGDGGGDGAGGVARDGSGDVSSQGDGA